MKNYFDFDGRVVIVTGAGRGLGLTQAKEFLACNAVVVVTDINEETLKHVKEEVNNPNFHTYAHNITDLKTTPGLIARIESEVGPIDHLVNNAGIHLKKPVWEVNDEEWQNIININLTGLFVFTREVVNVMKTRNRGSIVNISSMGGLMALPTAAGYVTTKTAVVGFTRSVAVDCGQYNIRSNAVCPGFIDTEMTQKVLAGDPARAAKIKGRIPMPRLGLGEDIAQACVFLSSDAASYINGQLLPVDGGYSIGF